MPHCDADVLIVGGGIAGASAAYFAARAGRRVTLVDAGTQRASDLPIALINPLRGKTGRVVPRGIEGTRATFALIDRLNRRGHRVVHGRGLFRPLIDVAPRAREREHWSAAIPHDFAFEWHAHAPSSLGLVESVPALRLAEAGWVAPSTLIDALKSDSCATVIDDEVTRVEVGASAQGGTVFLGSGGVVRARSLLWCGGAWGAARLHRALAAQAPGGLASDGLYKPGCLLTIPLALTREALAFGLYAVPLSGSDFAAAGSTVVGPTPETAQHDYPDDHIPEDAIARLQDRVARVFGASIEDSAIWRGVRLARLSTATARALRDAPSITALGSRGFLMAPLLASEWARSL